jgi:hypothetical protein
MGAWRQYQRLEEFGEMGDRLGLYEQAFIAVAMLSIWMGQ